MVYLIGVLTLQTMVGTLCAGFGAYIMLHKVKDRTNVGGFVVGLYTGTITLFVVEIIGILLT